MAGLNHCKNNICIILWSYYIYFPLETFALWNYYADFQEMVGSAWCVFRCFMRAKQMLKQVPASSSWRGSRGVWNCGLASCVSSTGFKWLKGRWMMGRTQQELNCRVEFKLLPLTVTNQTWESHFWGTLLVTPFSKWINPLMFLSATGKWL